MRNYELNVSHFNNLSHHVELTIAENKKLLTMAKEKKAAMKEVESAFSKQKDFLNHKTGSK